MKTKVKRLSKRTLAVFLGVLMLITSLGVGSLISFNAADNKIVFVELSASWAQSGSILLHYWGGSTSGDAGLSSYSGSIYTASIPSDSTGMKLHWNNGDWYGSDGDASNKNYAKLYESNGAKVEYGTYQVTSTASLAASSTSVSTGENVTLTPSLSSNTNYNVLKSTSYSVTTNPGSAGSVTSAGVFSASAAGTYTVTATVTYNAKGYTGITKTATATKNITVTAAATIYTSISAAAKGSTDGSTFNTTLSGTPATISANSYTTGSSALNISAGTVSGYTFYKWVVTEGSGTIGSATTASTTFTPSASNTTVTARYKKNYTFSNGTTDTHGTVTVPSGTVLAGASYSGTVTPAAGYKIKTLYVGGVAVSAAVGKTSAYTYSGTTGSSTTGTSTPISVVATFEAIPATTIYVKKTLASTFSNIHIWSNTSDNWTGAWPGQALSGWSSTTDGKYYYKSFNQDYSTFKFILNNNTSPQTNDSAAYATGKSYYIDSATANSAAVLTEGVPQASTITYNTGTGYTIGGTKPTSAYTGDTVSFTVTASSGYRIDKVQYTPAGGSATNATAGSNNEYHFTMPDKNVTVSVTAVKQYTVTLTAGTGFATKKYAVGSGSDQTYNSAITVDSGATVALKVTYTTGYEYDSANSTLDGAVASNSNKTFTLSNITADKTVTLAAKKISYSVSVDAKYSTNGTTFATDFPSGSKPAVTIAANTATQLDGVKVTAPADPTGYVFAGWATNAGNTNTTYFANYLDKDTTFKPNASNTTAIARYKKLFTITSSVDNTGTGAGTVDTSKTSVEAGGSYSITATPKSGSAIESVKVNDTAKTATASQTISSVSADQTVVVKFKSNVYVRGGSTIGTNWTTGDAMTSNADGTEFTKAYENVAGSSSGTQYQFKLYVNGYNNDGTATINITGGTSTGTCTHQSSGDQNYVLTLKKNANVTIKSNGTKITEIKVVPVNTTKHTVTFKKAANTTITGQYEGVNFSTASADAAVQVYEGDEISFTVTPASGYYISSLTGATFTPEFSSTVSDYKISNVTADKTVTPIAASKLSVKAVTNKSARGTVSVDPTTAYPGQTVTITVSPKNGVLKTLTYTYGSTTETLYPINNNNAQAQRSVDGIATFAFRDKVSKLMTSATAKLFSGADSTYTFTMPSSAVTVNATFDAYSGESTWYYNGYDTSGNAVSGYHTKQMTEGMVSGEKFSYYHVEGRTGADQLMTVSDGVPSSGTRYVYFVRPTDWGTGWSASNNPRAHFWNDTTSQTTWPGTEMTWAWNNDYGQGVYKTAIPADAKYVKFNDNNGKQTVYIDLTTTGGAYYLAGGGSGTNDDGYHIAEWNTGWADQGWVASGTEYFYQNSTHNGDYTGDFNTKGFYNHYTASKEFAKPKELGTNTGDYYINVLYPNTTYTINGVTKKTGSNPMIIWSAEPLAGDDETTTIYAKDGSIRSESYGSTYANIADTKIYLGNDVVGTDHSGNITNQTYQTYKAAKGDTIVIKTQIGATDSGTLSNAADLKAKYYVRGFCVNGEVSELLEWNADGLYTLTYKVPEDEDLSKIEITPIYYLKDTEANPIVTYRVTGFTDELKAVGSGKPNWGNTLYTYPFYGKLGSNNNALGAYPGQPMVYYKGQYQMQIPQKSTAWDIYYDDGALSGYSGNTAKANAVANTNVSGVTMSNGYYDVVHRQIAGFGDNSASADHVQTYDYGDFFKIFNEKAPVDNIVFDFKYRTKKHNFENQPGTTITKTNLDSNYGTNGNGFELLTNFHGRNVDLFGDPLSGDAADPSKTTPVYVVSIGGVNGSAGVENIAGYYATEWMVYGSSNGSSYSRISAGGKNSIPPEVLVLNDDDTTSFNTTTYPSADASHNLTNWKDLYTALEAYRGKPVMISYEAADAQIGAGNYATSGSGGATRNDGRWLYSKNGENITGKIKIQYSNDNGANYTDLDTEDPQVTGLSAYFTNDGVEGEMTYATTIDPDKTFDFEAKTTNADYKFVGWYMEDGTKITTDNASHTERSGSYTFVAKFMEVQGGQLILSHSVDTNATYKGAGTAKISAVVKDGEEVVRTYDLSTSDITLDDKIIKSDSTYTIDVTLEATATGNDSLGTTVLANPSGQESTYFNAASTSTEGKTKTIVLNSFTVASLFSGTTQNVKNIIYHSYFAAATFHYDLLFEYTDRTGNTKKYYRQGYLTSAQAANEAYVKVFDVGNDRNERRLMPEFIKKIAPHVSNFGEKITWKFVETGYAFNVQDHEYTLVNVILANQTKNDKRNVTFKLPYEHTNGVATLTDGVGTAATSTNFALTGENAVTFETIPTLLNNDTNGIFTEDGKKNWIAAPAVINDNGTQKFFQYWSIASTADEDNEVARCYFNGFNYAALDNYTITAKYGAVKTNIVDSGIFTGATYLETSRNQWNTKASSGKNDKDASGTRIAADLLYNDFVLNYNFKGVDIYKGGTDTDDIQELGIVVERIQELDTKQDGTKDTTISKYTGLSQNIDTVKAVINGTSSDKKFTKHAINKTDLDNKNRYRVYDAFYNGAGWDLEKQASAANYAYRNYVYRIYSYIKYTDDQGATQIALAELPSYFTMYDEATLTYQTRIESEEG